MAVPAIRDQFAAVKSGISGELSNRLADIAKMANAGIMALEPRPTGFVRTVDGTEGAPEEAVKPDGLIVYQYQRIDVILAFALDTLRTLSPRRSGAYQEAHTVFIDGAKARPPYVASSTSDVMIANPEPYARKIEVGHMHMTVPGTDHVYEQAEQIVKREFGEIIAVDFTYVQLPSAASLVGKFTRGAQPQSRKRLQKDTRAGATPTFPALVFSLK